MERTRSDPSGRRPIAGDVMPYLWLGLLGAAATQVEVIGHFAPPVVAPLLSPAGGPSEDGGGAEAALAPALIVAEDEATPRGNCELLLRTEPHDDGPQVLELRLHLVDAHHTIATWAASPRAGNEHRFRDLPPGTFHIEARGEGDVAASAPPWRCEGTGDRGALSLALPRSTARLEGVLHGKRGRKPVDGELLIEQAAGKRNGLRGPLHVPVDAEGTFLVALASGSYTLLGLAPRHASRTTEVTLGGGGTRVSLSLPYRPEARGVVVDARGQPVAGAFVFLGPNYDPRIPAARVRTDAAGRFTLPLAGSHPVTLAASAAAGFGTVSLPGITDDDGDAEVVLSLAPARQVRAVVEHADGAPCSFCEVSFRAKSHGLGGVVSADERGRALLVGLPLDADVEAWPTQGATGAWAGRVAAPGETTLRLTYVPPSW